ncbi:reverse transcriptase [Gossypium australe]|uniref:Reverse transcriptase n=1 Tax=Gossypium australe TaxID=47621 RepID=A0A5B6WGF5_9ROSI|nr:reverse transcriptase [Gossypium australe]
MKELYTKILDENILVELTKIQLGLNLETDNEEIFCEQRSHINWLTNGLWISKENEIMRMAICYFCNLFTTSEAGDASRIYGTVKRRISDEMSDNLLHPFREEEI